MTDPVSPEARSFSKSSVSLVLADALVDAAVLAAAELGFAMSFAVVDEGGQLKAFARMDGASFTSGTVAQDKAFTAAGGRPTHAWHAGVQGDEVLRAGAHSGLPRFITLGGGYPIVFDGRPTGGFGASGGHYSDDMRVAVAALAAVGAKHEW